MLRVSHTAIKSCVPFTAFSFLLLIFLLNFSGAAAALPAEPHRNSVAYNANADVHRLLPAAKATIHHNRHIQKIDYHPGRPNTADALARKMATFENRHDFSASISQPFVWFQATLRDFLVGIWTSIRAHTGIFYSPGGQCT